MRSLQPVKSESAWENLPNRSFLALRAAYEFDRRGGTITITDAGKKLITSAQQAERALLRDIISDDISDEDLNVLIRVGSDVNTRLDEVEKR